MGYKTRTRDEVISHIQDHVEVTERGCWEWQRGVDRGGYGVLYWRGLTTAHRVSYAAHVGDIPDGAYICHRCDNPGCVNPAHLYAGDAQTNSDDRLRGDNKWRRITGAGILDILTSAEGPRYLARKYDVTERYINYIKKGDRCAKYLETLGITEEQLEDLRAGGKVTLRGQSPLRTAQTF